MSFVFKKPKISKDVGVVDQQTFQSLKNKIINLPHDLWLLEEQRKEIATDQKFNDTITILNHSDPNHGILKYKNSFFNKEIYNELNPEIDFVINLIKEFYGSGEPKRIMLSLLKPKKNINRHIDTGFHLETFNRIHLPISTNKNVKFYINDFLVEMEEGVLIEINNNTFHSVVNDSTEKRIHLIIDWGSAFLNTENQENQSLNLSMGYC